MKKAIITLVAFSAFALAGRAAEYDVDPSHSYIGFAVRHMVVATVKGSFNEYEGRFEYDPQNPLAFKASATIQAASIDTRNKRRDDHLRNEDFFDVAKYPQITFESTGIEPAGDKYLLKGNLTMRGVTREISIPLTFNGPITDPWGNIRAGFEGSTVINRQDWGISWSKTLDTGGLVVSDEVTIEISIEGIQKKN